MNLPTFKTAHIAHSNSSQPEYKNLGLHSGAAAGNLGLVRYALDNGQPIDSVLNGVLPIHAACVNGNVAVVQYLIDHGADANAPRKPSNEKNRTSAGMLIGTTGSTPLHFAAANGCTQTVELLLKNGAIVDITDKYGSTPLSIATAKNHQEVVALLQKYSTLQQTEVKKNNSLRTTSKQRRSKFVSKKIKKPLLSPGKESATAFKFSYITRRRPSLPAEFEKAEMNAAAAAKVETIVEPSETLSDSLKVAERQPSKSMELSPYPLRRSMDLPSKTNDEILSDDEDVMSCLSDKPSIDMSYHSADESPDSKRTKSSIKDLFRLSSLSRQLTSPSMTSLSSSPKPSPSPDRNFSVSPPVTPHSNHSFTSLPMTPPDTPGTSSSTLSNDHVDRRDIVSQSDPVRSPLVVEKKKRRSTDPTTLGDGKWTHEMTAPRSTSESDLNSKGSIADNKKSQTNSTSRNFWATLRGEKASAVEPIGNTMGMTKSIFGRLTEFVLGRSI